MQKFQRRGQAILPQPDKQTCGMVVTVKRWLRIFSITWSLLFQIAYAAQACAQSTLRACDYVIYIRAQALANYFNFSTSPFEAITKVTISYSLVDKGSAGPESLYETLWYNGSQPLGCRRYRDFDLPPLSIIYIYLNASSAVADGAATNALVRILLDTKLNRNRIVAVEVPVDSFSAFVSQLQEENFYAPGKAPSATMPGYLSLTLIDSIGEKQSVVYAGNP